VRTGVAKYVLPELPALRMEVDEHHRHKDVYTHSLIVLRQAIDLEGKYGLEPDLVLRLAAILHDIGKPRTREMLPGGKVSFHHHEVVGAKMTRKRLTELKFPRDVINDVSRLVELHLRFHGYGDGEWTDSAVRRYVRDAGPLLTRLHALTRADCTTRNARKAARLAASYDALEARIEVLREQEELDAIRPELDGNAIMRILQLKPGPAVGRAYNFMMELRLSEGIIGTERATQELLRWAAGGGLTGSGGSGDSRPADSQ
jgi:poly(A) polymerase